MGGRAGGEGGGGRAGLAPAQIMAKMMGDKKNTEGKLKCVLLDRIGHCYEPKARSGLSRNMDTRTLACPRRGHAN